jgi:prepilin-type N-terminal cleavage/methylation domain-containing protein
MRRAREGFTLIEVVISIVLLAAGALALAGTAAVTARRMAESSRRSSAVSMARSRAEVSMASPCAALTSGSETIHGVQSAWVATSATVSTELSQRVSYPTSRGDRSDDFLTAAPCP